MKKRIVIGLSLFSLIFFLGGIYIVITIEKATSTLDNLIKLHQVEILREQLLIDVKRVQSDLAFKHTHYSRELDTVVSNVIQMGKESNKCLGCHHSEQVMDKIKDLINQIHIYKDALSRVLTIRANIKRLEAEEDMAYQVGQELINRLNTMTSLTKAKLEQKTQSSLKEIAEMKILLFILIALGPLLAIGLAIFFIKGFTQPLNILLHATRKLQSGDLSFRIQGLKDEFGEVGASFNEMASSLKEQMHNMQRTEQMAVCGQLAAGLAHEIKNPLAGIKVAIEVLSDESTLSRENQDVLSKVIAEIKRIEFLIKILLEFARPPKSQFMRTDLNSLLESSLAFATTNSVFSRDPSKSIKILKNLDDHLPEIHADPQQLRQVFINLLLNANEAMPNGGTIAVRTIKDSSEGVEVAISDTGKGISPDTMGKIFQPFFTTKPKGTGLGLAISKQLVELHGGTITVENTPRGGAQFRIKIPIDRPERHAL